ncbi:hypothetical protein DAPPUDRAFT_258978 [Daphnia pulex]|uniref:Uncharacterized protein n=1 Tax=Daphnia pulex TaxID=6669 RepID=E9HGC8_DAPPU|nr:hypothetical protein DAPPUDRAFT_258978 [Daphnia pulex]|eukprot:EFX69203.1 hypothetical protein DAPPUDRAFT_258978 [Daphnia pulex]
MNPVLPGSEWYGDSTPSGLVAFTQPKKVSGPRSFAETHFGREEAGAAREAGEVVFGDEESA